MVTDLDELDAIAEWLGQNLRVTHGRLVENVWFQNIKWCDNLFKEAVGNHTGGFKGRSPRDPQDGRFGPLKGFYGDLCLDLVTIVDDVYDNAYRNIFEGTGIPIHQVNQSLLHGGGREISQWFVEKEMILEATDTILCSDREPRRVVKESTSRYRFRIFMFGSDWSNLSDSFRVRNLLMGAA